MRLFISGCVILPHFPCHSKLELRFKLSVPREPGRAGPAAGQAAAEPLTVTTEGAPLTVEFGSGLVAKIAHRDTPLVWLCDAIQTTDLLQPACLKTGSMDIHLT
jgi:hypothetical protein